MLKNTSKYIIQIIFSHLSIPRTIEIIKISKEFIDKLEMKQKINMNNFCKIFYQNIQKKPSLYILLRHFKSKISKTDFTNIYAYYMNNYIKNNPNEIIEFNLELDKEIIQNIISNNLLKTKKISLILSSYEIFCDKELNFKNYDNIEQIYFDIKMNKNFSYNDNIINNKDIIFYEKNEYKYNELEMNPIYEIYYLLNLKYFNKFIPKNISKIGFKPRTFKDPDISLKKLNLLLKKMNINININMDDNEKFLVKEEKVLNFIFEELFQYKNIKTFTFYTNNEQISLLNNNSLFFQNLDELILEIQKVKWTDECINKLNQINSYNIKNKIKINLYDVYLSKAINELNSNLNYNHAEIVIRGNIKVINDEKFIFFKKLKSLDLEIFSKPTLNLYPNFINLEILHMKGKNEYDDLSFFKYLSNLKELELYDLELIDDNALDNLFNIFNEFNQNLIKLYIELFKFKNYLYDKEIKIKNNIELKNLKDFCFKFSDMNNNYYFVVKRYKINKLNIEKCFNLEKIRVPFYFECNNIDILNNL